jgi:integrase
MASLIRRYYTTTDPKTGRKVRKRSPKWYGQYVDEMGIRQRVPLSENKTAAQQMLNELVRKAELAKVGIVDRFEAFRNLPLTAHLADYRLHLEAKNNDARYISQAEAHCNAIFDGTGAKYIGDLDAGKVALWLAEQRREHGMGISTSYHYLTSIKGFTRWLTKTNPPRSENDRLACLSRVNAEADIRRKRRAASVDEAHRLLEAARSSDRDFRGLNGEDRFVLYAVALQTGFRAAELASLRRSSFDLDATPPTATVAAAYTKNGELAVQPLPRELVEILRPWLEKKPVGRLLWPGTWAKRAFRMIAADLAVARAAWIAEAGDDAKER